LGEGRGGVAAAVAAAAAAAAAAVAAAAAASSSSAYSDLHLSLATAKAFNCNHMRNSVARMLTLTAKHLECVQRFERSAAGIDRSNM
jgi:predicted component of type VI protein secretion system